MALESSIQQAGRISLWVGSCSGSVAIILCLVLFYFKVGSHDEGFAYIYLSLLLATLISLIAFVIGAVLSFAAGLNVAINTKRAKGEESEGSKDV
jgi:ABC-type multidrug transport system permease subunit